MITRVFHVFNGFFMDFDGDFVDYLRVCDDFMGFHGISWDFYMVI
jgi:hypothetical protein